MPFLRNRETRKTILQMLMELTLVAMGVYLGIIASNWNDQRKDARKKREFIQVLVMEISANKQKLEQANQYRHEMLNTSNVLLQQFSSDTLAANFWEVGGFKIIPNWQGVNIPPLENSVYQSGLITNTLSGLDFTTLNEIAQVYSHQEEYKVWTRTLITDRILNVDANSTTRDVLSRIQPWADIISMETEWINRYETALSKLPENRAH
jgi:hypothetical protein